jgi:hypothetical protein
LGQALLAGNATLIATLPAVLVIGALIGSIGIGAILLSPWLIDDAAAHPVARGCRDGDRKLHHLPDGDRG